jgi:hypothetical protein
LVACGKIGSEFFFCLFIDALMEQSIKNSNGSQTKFFSKVVSAYLGT